MSDPVAIASGLKAEARRLGFDLVGVCSAVTPGGVSRLHEWLAAGYAGEMAYLERREAAYSHPSHVLEGVRSLVVLGVHYRTREPLPPEPGQGRVSRYAWGLDYHDLIRERLQALGDWLRGQMPNARVRGVVDTAPLLEREFAQLAGLGWIGKNTLLINRDSGSWLFLAVLLTTAELPNDEPHETDHCGTCRACLDACPTDAFVAPYVLDARRCISYLTIELRGPMPSGLRPGVGDWVFGCDVCQDVCPWNRRAPQSAEAAFQPIHGEDRLDLVRLFDLTDAEFRERFRATPLWRARRRGLLRNAAIALGNRPTLAALPALRCGLQDAEPLVRGACAWALGQLADPQAEEALLERLALESDPAVNEELNAAIREWNQRMAAASNR